MIAWLRSLDPRLPRSVYTLQLGGLFNAFGNGLVLPFTFIYLYNVRGIGTATVGLIVATTAVVSIVAGPAMGTLIDRVGGRRMLVIPPDLAYGPQGSPPTIGPNETLVFVIDLLDVK